MLTPGNDQSTNILQTEQALKDKLLERAHRLLEVTAEDVCTRDVLSCDYDDLTAKAVRMILEQNFLGILIIKEGRPVNILTAFDLLRLAYEKVFDPRRDFLRMPVGELIKEKEFIHIPPGTKLREVLNVMLEKRVRTVPILDGTNVLGVCSMIDLLRWYHKTHEEVHTGKL